MTVHIRRGTWIAATVVVAALFTFPLLVMLSGSFRLPGSPAPRNLELVPNPTSLEAYREAFGLVPLARAMLNSFVIAAVYAPIAVLVASWMGFAISQVRGRRRRTLIGALLAVLVVPLTAMWIPRFLVFEALGLVGTYVPLIATALLGGSPFFALLYAFSFSRVPADVFDAARMEGAGPLRVWRLIGMPLVRRTTAAVAVLAFVQSWANFIDPLLYLNREGTYTAPVVLRFLEELGPTNWPVMLAGAVAVTAPVVLLFLLVQRLFLTEERSTAWAR